MADVYKFRVKLQELEKYLWRDIEDIIPPTIAKLSSMKLKIDPTLLNRIGFKEPPVISI